eukprot:2432364-Pleurochrysis_carterae.AAC.1
MKACRSQTAVDLICVKGPHAASAIDGHQGSMQDPIDTGVEHGPSGLCYIVRGEGCNGGRF